MSHVLLIPGLWLDGSSWDAVLPALAGHDARPLTLPGMTRGADRSHIALQDHIDAVVAEVDALAGEVVLVGHSGGAAVAHGAVDARPDRIARAIYVDAVPTGPGECVNDRLPVVDGEIPLPDWDFFDAADLVDLDREELRRRAIPSPARVATDPQQLSDERRYDVPVTVIACGFSPEQLREWLAAGFAPELQKIRDVSYRYLPTGHWPQLTRPHELGLHIAACL